MTDACFSRTHSVQGTKNAMCCLLALALETPWQSWNKLLQD